MRFARGLRKVVLAIGQHGAQTAFFGGGDGGLSKRTSAPVKRRALVQTMIVRDHFRLAPGVPECACRDDVGQCGRRPAEAERRRPVRARIGPASVDRTAKLGAKRFGQVGLRVFGRVDLDGAARGFHFDPQRPQDFLHDQDVGEWREILQHHRLVGQASRRASRQRLVLVALRNDFSRNRRPADHVKSVINQFHCILMNCGQSAL